jgi:hypothetical protein
LNLHLTTDEKFIDLFIQDIEELNLINENDFVGYKNNGEFLYIKNKHVKLIINDLDDWNYLFSEKIKKYERVFIHFFDPCLYKVIKKIPKSIKIIWAFYGYDGFVLLNDSYFLQEKTNKLNLELWKSQIIPSKRPFFPFYILRKKINKYFFRIRNNKYFSRINYVGNIFLSDFSLIKNVIRANFEMIDFTLASMEAELGTLTANESKSFISGEAILVGNSSAVTNNHLDLFDFLKNIELGERKMYCPLSYGNNLVAAEVEKAGTQLFGSNFIALRNFMSLEEYNLILKNCGFVFINSDRSQGGANIIISVYNGAKVFLSYKNPWYSFLKGLGIKIYSIQHNLDNSAFIPLSDDDKQQNRERLYAYYGKPAHQKRLIAALNI